MEGSLQISNATKTSPTDRGQATELMSLQRTNFRAFHRQINRLKVDEIQDKWELEDELRNIQTRWNAIDALHLQIDNILQGSDTQYDSEFYAYEDSYKSIKKALNLKLTSTIHHEKSTPQIDLPTFTGKYTQWPTFYDLYVESIHNNNLITKNQKMQHLKSKLRGDAERIIQHLTISADNYDTAWELLTHRYNNPQLLFTKQIEIFINLPAAQKQSAYEIRRIYDTSMECIYAIKNLGIDTSTWDPLLVHIITKKLDTVTYNDYKEARKMPRELPSLSELMDFLESKFIALEPSGIRDREMSSSFKKYNQQKSVNNKTYKPQFQKEHRYGKLINKEYQSVATYMSNCPICDKKHPLYKCEKFIKLTPGERYQIIKDFNFCHNCLYAHNKNLCTSMKKCKLCKKSHNTMLHDAYTININKQSTNSLTDMSSGSSTQLNTQTPQKYQMSSCVLNRQDSTKTTKKYVKSNKKYEKNKTKFSVNEALLRALLKNQTSVIEAQYNILQRNEEILNKQFGILLKFLTNLSFASNRTEKIANNELHILSSSVSAMIISNLRHLQESVINTLTSLANCHLDDHFSA
ncbi:uncharacterized protein LOC123654893 [Melitaea cinxia]|uniref:uncharacterized protein LOC123654893 n=1 Tax=Melitaea cinxia TaxID=113334 RepID=UPI001E270BCE|nr:uncharacterized protein LOC123654893 [Melitaea cinxia]